ncbi:hypothetical protein SCHPADRAFT_542950 [Schizopora paradoxa]|uniref:Uncharacterized protein n=1 Tax=Schizopora paradoxa TaxID=27342 RepID=A0A0H2RYU4_9AGAM|nr:hypothetical protein SCHPADRAFT_542950 [Schizopora paradoxa]
MYIICAVLFSTLKSSKTIIAVATAHALQAVGSVLSARFILQLRSYLTDLTMQSMSVPPEHIMRVEKEINSGGRKSSGDISGGTVISITSTVIVSPPYSV